MRYHCGFSFIEIIMAITIIAIVSQLSILASETLLLEGNDTASRLQAGQRAKARMELTVGQIKLVNNIRISDPCAQAAPPAACANTQISTSFNGNLLTITSTGTADDLRTQYSYTQQLSQTL